MPAFALGPIELVIVLGMLVLLLAVPIALIVLVVKLVKQSNDQKERDR
jgi:hypothetical protein